MTLTAPTPIETTAKSPLGDAVPITRKPFVPSPLNRRRWQNFRAVSYTHLTLPTIYSV